MRLIDADELLKQPLDTANYPSNYVKNAPTVNSVAIETLDNIKAEIVKIRDSWEKDCYHEEAEALTLALKIIDKYR